MKLLEALLETGAFEKLQLDSCEKVPLWPRNYW